jgi:hypothetical protein
MQVETLVFQLDLRVERLSLLGLLHSMTLVIQKLKSRKQLAIFLMKLMKIKYRRK